MTGRSHKAVGLAVGAAFVIYGYRYNIPIASVAIVSAPIAAMLPDIDHENSKAGRALKKFSGLISSIALVAIVGLAIYWAINFDWVFDIGSIDWYRVLTIGVGLLALIVLIVVIGRTRFGKNTLKFATKHRGIMHTFLLPVGLFFLSGFLDGVYLFFLYGFIAGYVSHIVADTFTKAGCPILFPVFWKNIKFTNITTGSKDEKWMAFVLILLIIIGSVFVL